MVATREDALSRAIDIAGGLRREMTLTFLDAGVPIAAAWRRGGAPQNLGNPKRPFASSEFLWLEVLPRQEAVLYGLSAMDAIRIAAASILGAEELVTTERPTKPMHRTPTIAIRTLHGDWGE
jgi:hypothetical protein